MARPMAQSKIFNCLDCKGFSGIMWDIPANWKLKDDKSALIVCKWYSSNWARKDDQGRIIKVSGHPICEKMSGAVMIDPPYARQGVQVGLF